MARLFERSAVALVVGLAVIVGGATAARGQQVKPGRMERVYPAEEFLDSMGVCTHWGYPDTPYGARYEEVKKKLFELGLRHVRDGFNERILDLARSGVMSTVVAEPDVGSAAEIVARLKAINRQMPRAVAAVEGPNEPDIFWERFKKSYKGHGHEQGQSGIIKGAVAFQRDLYAAIRKDPATRGVTVIGPALGKTYGYDTRSPLGAGTLAGSVDWGNFHPYPGGNPFSVPFGYAGIEKYLWHGTQPSANLDEFPFAFDVYGPPFGKKPMAATETGYSTWTPGGQSEAVHGKYVPRLFAEYFLRGLKRTYLYELVDEFPRKDDREANFGLLRHDLTEKPGYESLKRLIGVLAEEKAGGVKVGTVAVSVEVTMPGGYERSQYLRRLVLRKKSGEVCVLLWHEIALEDASVVPHRELMHPNVSVAVGGLGGIKVVRVVDLGQDGVRTLTVDGGRVRLEVPDRVVVVRVGG